MVRTGCHLHDLKSIREFRDCVCGRVSEIRSWQITWPMPVNLKRPIWNAQKTFKIDLRRPSDMHPMEIVEAIDKLQERHLYTRTDEGTQLCL